MAIELKTLSKTAIKSALEKAVHYRLLNEPLQAESICRDVLDNEAGNQAAIVSLILALTDQFPKNLGPQYRESIELVEKLQSDHDTVYYQGIIAERRAMVHMNDRGPESGHLAHEWFEKAMVFYEKAESLSETDDDSAVLRWNTCARIINRHPAICAPVYEEYRPYIED